MFLGISSWKLWFHFSSLQASCLVVAGSYSKLENQNNELNEAKTVCWSLQVIT